MSRLQFKSYLTEAFTRPAPWLELTKPTIWGRVGKYEDLMHHRYFAVSRNEGLDTEIGVDKGNAGRKYHSGYGVPVTSGEQMDKWVQEKVSPLLIPQGMLYLPSIQAHIFRVSFGHAFVWGENKGSEIRPLVTADGKRIYELSFARLVFPVHLDKISGHYYWSDEHIADWNTSNDFVDNDVGDLNPRQSIGVFGTVIEIAKAFTRRSDFGGLLFGRKQDAKSSRGRIYGGLAQRVGASIGLKSYEFPQGDRHFSDMGGPSTDTVLVVKSKSIYDECVAIADEASRAQRGVDSMVAGLQAYGASLNKPKYKPIQQIKY